MCRIRSASSAIALAAVLGFSLPVCAADKQLERMLKERYEGRIVRLHLMTEQQFRLKLPKEDSKGASPDTRIYMRVDGIEMRKARIVFRARRAVPYMNAQGDKLLATSAQDEYRLEWSGAAPADQELLKAIEIRVQPVQSIEEDWPDYWAQGTQESDSSGTGGSQNAPTVERIGGAVKPPECGFCPNPEFTDEARKQRITGVVKLHAVFMETGQVAGIRVKESLHPELDAAAALTVGRWRFKPATKNGQPVRAFILVEIKFQTFD